MAEPEVAYYYPQPYWSTGEVDQLKSLLLFFDRIAILLPRYMRGREVAADPVLAGPLLERGLLEILEPESFVDQGVADALAEEMGRLIEVGAFAGLDKKVWFAELSRSRMGWDADVDLAKGLIKDLKRLGLAKKSEDGMSVPLHPVVRTTILVLLSQLARERGHRMGLDLHPVTGDMGPAHGVLASLSLPAAPSAGHVVSMDLETVGVDLAAVPLDELLAFRQEHGAEYKAYARDLRRFVATLGPLPPPERTRLLADRREEMADRAHDLRRTAMRTWQQIQPIGSIGLGVVGAAWFSDGNVGAAALAIATGIVGATIPASELGAYTYMYSVRDSLGAADGFRRDYMGWPG